MNATVFASLALAAASFILGGASDSSGVGLGLVSACMAAVVVGPRLAWTAMPQAAMAFAVVVIAAVVGSVMDSGPLHPFFAALALGALGIGVGRLFIVAPAGGHGVTIAIGLASVLASGTERTDQPFVELMTIYLLLGLVAIRAGDRGRPQWGRIGPGRWVFGAAGLVLSIGLAIGLASALPALYERFAWTPNYRPGQRTGFSGDNLKLGSLRQLLQSDRVVMRLHGPTPTHLRGEVYRRFSGDKWIREYEPMEGHRSVSREGIEMAQQGGEAITEVWVVADPVRHIFLPLGWSDLFSDPPEIQITVTGTVRTRRGEPVEQYSFWVGETPMAPPVEPRPRDVDVPLELLHDRPAGPGRPVVRGLRSIAREWIAEATTDRDKLDAIQRSLRTGDFTYSTNYVRHKDDSYLLQFFEDKRGHCEYFASAMALLGRTVGISTRVIGGYHVSERNPFGDYAVVRDRDAHAWVEAWLPDEGGWVTFDPTPPGEVVQTQAPFFSAFVDWISDELRRRGPLGLVIPLLVILAIVLIRRFLRLRRVTRPRLAGLEYDAPPPYVEEFLSVLAARGFRRPSHEPIERFARRLAAADRLEEAELLHHYSAERFGGGSDPLRPGGDVETGMTQWVRSERKSRS